MILNKIYFYEKYLSCLFLTAVFLFFGCNGRNGNDSSSEKPRQGGTLNIALAGDIDSFNPVVSSTDIATASLQDLLFPALTAIRWNDTLGYVEYEPLLASDWEISPEKNCVKFTLKKNAYWSNGSKLNFKDIVYSYRLYSHPLSASPNGYHFEYLYNIKDSGIDTTRSVTIINDSTFAVQFAASVRNPMHFSILKLVPSDYYGSDYKRLRENKNNFKPDNYSFSIFSKDPVRESIREKPNHFFPRSFNNFSFPINIGA